MGHALILGMTESGKTTLAKRLVTQYRARSVGTIVLDPLGDPSWNADKVVSDPDEFLRVFWQSRSCCVFIDESGDAVGRYDNAMIRTATRGRHWGHVVHYLTQRGTQVAQTVRDQCSRLFLFATSKHDATILAREWNMPELVNASQLRKGEFFAVNKFGACTRHSLF